ncbi:hypothetical protein B296_00018709 [Ensete ventricosum]|uniref:Uncharacterized protein n=1 Tax=Ensete ventricosum TaxID=4639 RepID=A0A426XXZ9_ENSVE|nr:hypothetical protein B296_00018709 [Ensete ventricosum]
MRDVVYLSIDQEELLGEHKGVEAVGRKGRGSDDESRGAQLPKSKVLIRKEVDSEECHSAAEVDLSIAKKGMEMQSNGELGHGLGSAIVLQRRDFHGVINPLLSWRKSIEAMKFHKIGVDALLIKITKNEGLRVDAGVLDQEIKEAIRGGVPFLLRGVGYKDDGEDGTIPKATRTIK